VQRLYDRSPSQWSKGIPNPAGSGPIAPQN